MATSDSDDDDAPPTLRPQPTHARASSSSSTSSSSLHPHSRSPPPPASGALPHPSDSSSSSNNLRIPVSESATPAMLGGGSGSGSSSSNITSKPDLNGHGPGPSASPGTPHKSRSILNLTSPTLFGIYSRTGYDTSRTDELATPWGTGAQTPARSGTSPDDRQRARVPSTADFGLRASAAVAAAVAAAAAAAANTNTNTTTTTTTTTTTKPPLPPTTTTTTTTTKAHRGLSGAGGVRPRRPTRTHSRSGGAASRWRWVAGLVLRTVALFVMGIAYGTLITHLHDARSIAPVKVDAIDRSSPWYLLFWGVLAVVLGGALPLVDGIWAANWARDSGDETAVEDEHDGELGEEQEGEQERGLGRTSLGADWNPIVRSIGALMAIAFAIRKLPWQSTLQVSLTLALVNPVIWYLIDRSKSGFILSTAVGVTGAAVLFSVNPKVVPAPATPSPRESGTRLVNASLSGLGLPLDLIGGLVSYETIGVATWISSVLFCSCVCFGNIGRRLAFNKANGYH